MHARVVAGVFAPRAGEAEASTRQHAFVDRLVSQCERIGPPFRQWADAALAARGVRAIRLIQGVLGLTRRHPRERVLAAVTEAHAHQHSRYQTIRQLVERTPAQPAPTLVTEDPAIRPMTQPTDADRILAAFQHGLASRPRNLPTEPPSLARVEWEYLHRVLTDCDGNVSEAARQLGMHRRSLQRKLAKYPGPR